MLTIAIPPYAEPVHLDEMKLHLKQDDLIDDDSLIASWIIAARDLVETGTGANVRRLRVMVATSFDLKLDGFPCGRAIELPRVPLISITSITYVDTAGVSQTMSSALYVADTLHGRIDLAYNESWPSIRYQPNSITVRFIAGEAAPFTVVPSTEVCTVLGRTFTTGDRLRVMHTGSGDLPIPLAVNTDYFAIAASGSTFQLALTSGGAAINVTEPGDGAHFIGLSLTNFEAMRSAVKLLVGYWYKNREAVMVEAGIAALPLPMAVDALIASAHA